ncbi:MAG: ABC transporter permease [Planctomycetota bacterium]
MKNVGIFVLLAVVVVVATLLDGNFVAAANLKTLIRDTSLYGLISIGVALVIITGGIDLSIGSMVALCGVLMVQVVNVQYQRSATSATVISIDRAEKGVTRIELESLRGGIRSGDQLVYPSVLGESKLVLTGMETVSSAADGTTTLRSNDPARSLREGMSVFFERIEYTSPLIASGIVLLIGSLLGLVHGLLITRGNLPPFVVTLCGLLIYRGIARVRTGDDQVGLGAALGEFKSIVTGSPFSIPVPLVSRLSGASDSWMAWTWIDFPLTGVLLIGVAAIAWVFLQRTVAGRHLLATGENETAARYSGVATKRLITGAYVACGCLSALAGILFLMEWNSVQPGSSGNFYELYAIAAAVLGGCSLRGGRGAVLGVIAGAAVMRCLYKAIVVLGIDQQWEMVIIGTALLGSVLVDEAIRRYRAIT